MKFDFNAYSTPLLFGFVQAWLFALLFWRRAWKHERLSDALFGCLMMALSMAVIASMIGAGGLGSEILTAISSLNAGQGVVAGLAIFILAVFLDRTSQGAARRLTASRQRRRQRA